MKVLVTGSTSLLARRAAQALLARGDDVVVVQRTRSTLDAPQVLGDLRDPDVAMRAADGCDGVIHAAAKVGVIGGWEEYRSVNVDGTANVLAAARFHGIGRVVHVSTPSVAHAGRSLVGVGAEPPTLGRRNAWYAESKAIGERLAIGASCEAMAVVAVRPHLVWGPGDTQLVGRIVDRARAGRLALVGDGAALIDTTYVDNAAEALLASLDAVRPDAPCAGRAYVIANGEPRPIRELVLGICRAAGVEVEPRRIPLGVAVRAGAVVEKLWSLAKPGDEPPMTRFLAEQLGTAHWFDPRPAEKDLGYRPSVSIDEGLRRLAEWYASGAPSI